jgi:hypothetical protein
MGKSSMTPKRFVGNTPPIPKSIDIRRDGTENGEPPWSGWQQFDAVNGGKCDTNDGMGKRRGH